LYTKRKKPSTDKYGMSLLVHVRLLLSGTFIRVGKISSQTQHKALHSRAKNKVMENERLLHAFQSFRPKIENERELQKEHRFSTSRGSIPEREFNVPPLSTLSYYEDQHIEPHIRPSSFIHNNNNILDYHLKRDKRHHPYENSRTYTPHINNPYYNVQRYFSPPHLRENPFGHELSPHFKQDKSTPFSIASPVANNNNNSSRFSGNNNNVNYPPPGGIPTIQIPDAKDSQKEDSDRNDQYSKNESSPKSSGLSPKKMSFGKAALLLLRESKVPMTTTELARRALERGIIKSNSRTPQFIMGTDISRDMKRKGDRSLFVRLSPGTYGLKGYDYSHIEGAQDHDPTK
jgi:hypothetical protein